MGWDEEKKVKRGKEETGKALAQPAQSLPVRMNC